MDLTQRELCPDARIWERSLLACPCSWERLEQLWGGFGDGL